MSVLEYVSYCAPASVGFERHCSHSTSTSTVLPMGGLQVCDAPTRRQVDIQRQCQCFTLFYGMSLRCCLTQIWTIPIFAPSSRPGQSFFFLFDRRFSVVAANPFFLFVLLSFGCATFPSLNGGYVVPAVVPVQEATCDHIL